MSMIGGSILYLLLAGLDLGTAAEQILNGLYNSYVLLAVPLFILAAELMNIGSLTDRLLQLLQRAGRPLPRRARARQRRREHHLRRHVGLGDRRRRRHRPHHHRHDDAATASIPIAYAAAITASAAIIGPIIPPSIPMVLYALVSDTSIGYLFLGGVIPGPAARRRASWS